MTAKIIQLNIKRHKPIERICSNCDNFLMNRHGIAFCSVYGGEILDEKADDCPAFDNPDVIEEWHG